MTSTPGGLEYAARYTHHYQDGRQVVVINSRCENPADRAWAAEQVANMARIQTACEWPVDACLVTRRTTTAWAPEGLTEAQRDGLACIICGAEDTESTAMAPAGFADGRQLFRCAADCTPPAPCGSESCAPTNCGYPVCSERAEPPKVTISPEAAAHVLFHLGKPGGYPASQFIQHLLRSFEVADVVNRARLGTGFPAYLAAFDLYRNSDTGMAELQKIAEWDGE